jgi:uncharacterized membrane protein YbhN (UPF0104 family)
MTISRRRLFHGALTLAVLALLVLYGRTIDWRGTWAAVRGASVPLLVVAMLANFVTLFAKAVTWWVFLRPVGAGSLGLAWRATAAGAALNNVLIANSGDAARAVFVTRASPARGADVVAALALERLFDFVGYMALGVAAAFLLPMPESVTRWRNAGVILLGAILLVLWFGARRESGIGNREGTAPEGRVGKARWQVARFFASVGGMLTPARAAAALALSALNWAGQVACYHLTAVAAHFPITVAGSIAVLLTANVGFIVRATPGNVGFFQFVYAITAQALGLPKDAAVATALLLQALQNIPVTLVGLAAAPEFVLHWRTPKPAA